MQKKFSFIILSKRWIKISAEKKMTSNTLFINPKWKKTNVQEALTSNFNYLVSFIAKRLFLITEINFHFFVWFFLSEISFRSIFDENLQLLDFRVNSFGLCYIPKSLLDTNSIGDFRKQLAKVHHVIRYTIFHKVAIESLYGEHSSPHRLSVHRANCSLLPLFTVKSVCTYFCLCSTFLR